MGHGDRTRALRGQAPSGTRTGLVGDTLRHRHFVSIPSPLPACRPNIPMTDGGLSHHRSLIRKGKKRPVDNLWTSARQPLDLWGTTFGLVAHDLWTSQRALREPPVERMKQKTDRHHACRGKEIYHTENAVGEYQDGAPTPRIDSEMRLRRRSTPMTFTHTC